MENEKIVGDMITDAAIKGPLVVEPKKLMDTLFDEIHTAVIRSKYYRRVDSCICIDSDDDEDDEDECEKQTSDASHPKIVYKEVVDFDPSTEIVKISTTSTSEHVNFMIDENKTTKLDRQVGEQTKAKTITNQMTSKTVKPEIVILETLRSGVEDKSQNSDNNSIDSNNEMFMIDEEDTTNVYIPVEEHRKSKTITIIISMTPNTVKPEIKTLETLKSGGEDSSQNSDNNSINSDNEMYMIDEEKTTNLDIPVEELTKPNTITDSMTLKTVKPETVKLEIIKPEVSTTEAATPIAETSLKRRPIMTIIRKRMISIARSLCCCGGGNRSKRSKMLQDSN